MQNVKWLNPNKEELTPEKLKEMLGENCTYTEDQLKDFVFTIKTFVHIVLQYQKRQDVLNKENEQQKIAA